MGLLVLSSIPSLHSHHGIRCGCQAWYSLAAAIVRLFHDSDVRKNSHLLLRSSTVGLVLLIPVVICIDLSRLMYYTFRPSSLSSLIGMLFSSTPSLLTGHTGYPGRYSRESPGWLKTVAVHPGEAGSAPRTQQLHCASSSDGPRPPGRRRRRARRRPARAAPPSPARARWRAATG